MITESPPFFENKGSNNRYLEVNKINDQLTSTESCAASIVPIRVRKSTHEDLAREGKYQEYRIFHGKYGDAMEPVKALQK